MWLTAADGPSRTQVQGKHVWCVTTYKSQLTKSQVRRLTGARLGSACMISLRCSVHRAGTRREDHQRGRYTVQPVIAGSLPAESQIPRDGRPHFDAAASDRCDRPRLKFVSSAVSLHRIVQEGAGSRVPGRRKRI